MEAMSPAPFASLALPNPRLGVEQVRAILTEHWGVGGRLDKVGSSQDQNFGVTDAEGRRFVLKVANPHWRRSELEMQNAAMLHTAARADGFDAPVPLPTRDGALIVRACDHDVRLLT